MNASNASEDKRKDPETLENEVDEARARLGQHVSELGQRLSPGELLDQGLSLAREHGGEFTRNLGRQVKANPVPLILTGIGLTWMMASSNSPQYPTRSPARYGRVGTLGEDRGLNASGANGGTRSSRQYGHEYDLDDDGEESMGERLKHGLSESRHQASERLHQASERAHHFRENVSDGLDSLQDRASHMQDVARERATDLQHSFEEMLHEQPLVAGAIGVAVGALVGALMPSTRTEDRLLGPTRERVVERGKHMAEEQVERGREKLEDTVEQVGERVREKSAKGGDGAGNGSRMGSSSAQQTF